MKKEKNAVYWLFKSYMVKAHITSLRELAKETGIHERTLENHIKNPELLRVFELIELDRVLDISDEDMVRLSRGKV